MVYEDECLEEYYKTESPREEQLILTMRDRL